MKTKNTASRCVFYLWSLILLSLKNTFIVAKQSQNNNHYPVLISQLIYKNFIIAGTRI